MRWVYILKCDDDFYYIGETSRLYRRFWEHNSGKGGINTSTYKPQNIIAIYNLERLGKFFNYNLKVNNNDYRTNYNIYFNRKGIIEIFNDNNNNVEDEGEEYSNLWVENNITEKMMLDNKKNWKKIRGGKYVRLDIEYNFPTNEIVKDLPNCKCKLPCDIKKNEKNNYLYFRCAKNNIWDGLTDYLEKFNKYGFYVENDACNFFKEYKKDKFIRSNNYNDNINKLIENTKWLRKVENTDRYQPMQCKGGCKKGLYYSKIKYNDNKLDFVFRKDTELYLCYDCFIDKYDKLKNKYSEKVTSWF